MLKLLYIFIYRICATTFIKVKFFAQILSYQYIFFSVFWNKEISQRILDSIAKSFTIMTALWWEPLKSKSKKVNRRQNAWTMKSGLEHHSFSISVFLFFYSVFLFCSLAGVPCDCVINFILVIFYVILGDTFIRFFFFFHGF